MAHENNYFAVKNAKIYYEISGNVSGKPLLMLHGGLGSSNDLAILHQYLAADYKLISVDFRGHGKSFLGELPLSYSLYQQDIQALLNELDIEQYAIFGFSDGGIVGYRLAAQNPDKVTCLVTLGSQWRLEDDDPSIEQLSGLTAEFWRSEFADDVASYQASNPKPDFDKLVAVVKNVWLDTSDCGYPNELVTRISCPTLVMRGDDDFLLSHDEAIQLVKRLENSSFANIPLSTHAAHQESPRIVGELLKQFLAEKNMR